MSRRGIPEKNSIACYPLLVAIKGHYIKYLEGGGFCGVMKYFRYILMGHEIFFKIFYGPKNVFRCSIFLILMFFKVKGVGAQNIQTGHQGDLRNGMHVK